MDLDILKIDLDLDTLYDVNKILIERLSYINDIGAFSVKNIDRIIASKKKTYNVKIYLSLDLSPELIIMLQLILGSDYRKEINTMLNHFKLNMEYSNRLFDIKRYNKGEYKFSEKVDITKHIKEIVLNNKRKKFNN